MAAKKSSTNTRPRASAHPSTPKRSASPKQPTSPNPKLLSGGNPQIAKADGDAPVQAYIAAMPGWKSDAGRRLDAIITRAVPGVRKAVRWNSPFYGSADGGWFLGLHCFNAYIKIAFFDGAALDPLPPVASKDAKTRDLHIREDEPIDEAQLRSGVRQASALPGWSGK